MIYRVVPGRRRSTKRRAARRPARHPADARPRPHQAAAQRRLGQRPRGAARARGRVQGTAGRSDDYAEGVAAFLGKRKPRLHRAVTRASLDPETADRRARARAPWAAGSHRSPPSPGIRSSCSDVETEALERARAGIDKAMAREVEKGRLTRRPPRRRAERIRYVGDAATCSAFAPLRARHRGDRRGSGAQAARSSPRSSGWSRRTAMLGDQHLVPLGHRHRRRLPAPRAGGRRSTSSIPAPVMPLVEIVRGHATDADAARCGPRADRRAGARPPSSPPTPRASS